MSFNAHTVRRSKNHLHVAQRVCVPRVWLLAVFLFVCFLLGSRVSQNGLPLESSLQGWRNTEIFLDVSQAFFPNPVTTGVVPLAAATTWLTRQPLPRGFCGSHRPL